MVLLNVEFVHRISDYLEVPRIELHTSINNVVTSSELIKGHTIEGVGTIMQALAARSKIPGIVGTDRITKALTQQWIEYAVLYVNYADTSSNARRVLKELNDALTEKTYITGIRKTIADIILYYSLHSIMSSLNDEKKAVYVNVSRWFDNIQQEEKLHKDLDLINFDHLNLYASI